MKERKRKYTERGMLFGFLIGVAAGSVMYAMMGEVFFFGLLGVGLALGLGLGAALDRNEQSA